MKSVEDTVKQWRGELKSKAEDVNNKYKIKAKNLQNNLVWAYKETKQIRFKIDQKKVLHDWGAVYYLSLLYIDLTLTMKLLQQNDKKYIPEKNRVTYDMLMVEKLIPVSKKGMSWQVTNKREKIKAQAIKDAEQQTKLQTQDSNKDLNAAIDALRLDNKSTNINFNNDPNYNILNNPSTISTPTTPPTTTSSSINENNNSSSGISDEKISANGKQILKVMGDGHCAYRSIAQGIADGKLTKDKELKNALQLRKLSVDLLKKNAKKEMAGSGLTVEQIVLMKEDIGSFSKYIEGMTKTDFAGETEMHLLSEQLNISIAVFTIVNGTTIEHMVTYNPAKGRKLVCLLWQRGSYSEAGNHYDCLI